MDEFAFRSPFSLSKKVESVEFASISTSMGLSSFYLCLLIFFNSRSWASLKFGPVVKVQPLLSIVSVFRRLKPGPFHLKEEFFFVSQGP